MQIGLTHAMSGRLLPSESSETSVSRVCIHGLQDGHARETIKSRF